MEETPRIEVCVNTKIRENENLTPKTLPVDYADILEPITKNMQSKKINSVLSEINTVKNTKSSLRGKLPYGVCYKHLKNLQTK